jgi:hypothetical protein
MTLILESTTTAVSAEPTQCPAADFEAPNRWTAAAVRAHALLSQTMTDEQIDELVDAAAPFAQPIVLPAFLFG